MLINYLKIAIRSIRKNKLFSAINIAGLAIGMAACLLILQYVSFELSYDRFNVNANDLYRVTNDRYREGKLLQHGTITYSAIGKALKDDYPEVVDFTRVEPYSEQVLSNGDKMIGDVTALAADNSFLSMFSYPFIAGDSKSGLQQINTVILTETLARKLFDIKGNNFNEIVGKTVVITRDKQPYKITAICKDVPENSHLQFDALISYNTLYAGNGNWKEADYDFTDSDFWQYILLKRGTDYKELEAKLDAFSQRHFQGTKVSGSVEKFHLQPLIRAHLYSDYEYEIGKTGNATVVWGLLIIAVLIIIIAWVNYVNLSTAKSLERAKEVGIRKVTGATRSQLIRQFLTESLVINLFAIVLAVLTVSLVQNSFNALVQHQLSFAFLLQNGYNGYALTIAVAVLLIAGILGSGFYPAFVLSAFKPISVLKGKFVTSSKGIVLRKVLVVSQFAITIALIIGSFVVYKQIRFLNAQELGMNISQMLVVKPPLLTHWDSTFIGKENSFKNELKQLPHIYGASVISRTAGDEMSRVFNVRRTDKNLDEQFSLRRSSIDADFIPVYGIKVIAGRNFTATDFNPDWDKLHNIIINAAAVKQLGFSSSEGAVGKKINFFGKDWDIVGVMNDFHQKSLHYPIEPTIFQPSYGTDNPICIKVNTKALPSTIVAIKTKFETFFPGNYFDYYFLDDKFNKLYRDDELFGKVFGIFAGFAIFIACLGLMGLSLFATAQRTKEIGVRKVLGASVANIVALLSKDFIKLVLIAFVIATPVAWFAMYNWLHDFAYRINIEWWLFALAGLMAVAIALATISFQSIKAALSNPVKSLRTE
ncbi:FtsX-like permease family protein [Ilyomonas limi]|uniref:FtsX-like permease family protein n=1 Tax=Ilyomonas limi TaxID=2575867 RepID=A0A4U3L019_9BACT|nr:ABC transporter permease [Ilyomonas limi]TKK68268.1 FtsX-like permease family protein [Ilyomonas limi]